MPLRYGRQRACYNGDQRLFRQHVNHIELLCELHRRRQSLKRQRLKRQRPKRQRPNHRRYARIDS